MAMAHTYIDFPAFQRANTALLTAHQNGLSCSTNRQFKATRHPYQREPRRRFHLLKEML